MICPSLSLQRHLLQDLRVSLHPARMRPGGLPEPHSAKPGPPTCARVALTRLCGLAGDLLCPTALLRTGFLASLPPLLPSTGLRISPASCQVEMVFTSVAGHLLELEFEPRVKGWHSCSPRELYDASVFKGVPKVGAGPVQATPLPFTGLAPGNRCGVNDSRHGQGGFPGTGCDVCRGQLVVGRQQRPHGGTLCVLLHPALHAASNESSLKQGHPSLPCAAPPCLQGENEKMRRNLQQLARTCQWLVLWLDCDREGENIAFEVIQVGSGGRSGGYVVGGSGVGGGAWCVKCGTLLARSAVCVAIEGLRARHGPFLPSLHP